VTCCERGARPTPGKEIRVYVHRTCEEDNVKVALEDSFIDEGVELKKLEIHVNP
jgi:RNA binding exosome subunit